MIYDGKEMGDVSWTQHCKAIEYPLMQAPYLRRYRFKSATHLETTAGLVKIVSMLEAVK